jgi:hypothetical protein
MALLYSKNIEKKTVTQTALYYFNMLTVMLKKINKFYISVTKT